MKLDIILSNPPYDTNGSAIHQKFVDKCLHISDKQIVVMPFTFLTVDNKNNNKYKQIFNDYIVYVEEVKSSAFEGTCMPNVGIYVFHKHKKEDNITINYIDKGVQCVNDLFDIKKITGIEKEILDTLSSKGRMQIMFGGNHPRITVLKKYGIDETEAQNIVNRQVDKSLSDFPANKVYLLVSNVNGGMNAKFISSRNGQIFDNINDLYEHFYHINMSSGYNIIICDNVKQAQHCKEALKRPLLRFTCYKTQDNIHLKIYKCYKYIPNIDWENIYTDEDILIACGCDKDKAKEYVEYCKEVIDEVDNK